MLRLALIEKLAALLPYESSLLRAYRKAQGNESAISDAVREQAATEIAKLDLSQPWTDGTAYGLSQMPSAVHLEAIAWGHSPDEVALTKWSDGVDFEPLAAEVVEALAVLAKADVPAALVPIRKAAASLCPPLPARQGVAQDRVLRAKIKRAFAERGVLLKADTDPEERFVMGVVLEPTDGTDGYPQSPDTDNDVYSAAEIRKAAHWWAEFGRWKGIMHGMPEFEGEFIPPGDDRVVVLESYIALTEIPAGTLSDRQDFAVRKGTWLMAFRINDGDLWEAIKGGTYNGLSMGGDAIEIPIAADSTASE